MHHLLAVVVAEGVLDLVGAEAADSRYSLRPVVGDAAGYAPAILVQDVDDISPAELAGYARDSGGQKAAVVIPKGPGRPGVGSPRVPRRDQPLLTRARQYPINQLIN